MQKIKITLPLNGLIASFFCAMIAVFFPVNCNASAPAAPTSVSASDVPSDYGSKINLTWAKSSDDGGGSNNVTSYRVYRATYTAGYDYSVKLFILPAGSQSYQDYTTNDGTTFYYVIRAYNGTQESSNSNEANTHSIPDVIGDTVTYNFSTNAGSDKWAYRGDNSDYPCRPPAEGPDVSGQTELNSGQYSKIASIDGQNFGTQQQKFNYTNFKFTISESTASIAKIQVTWVGYSEDVDAHLYIWNYASSTWNYIDKHTLTTADATLKGSFGDHISDYIDSSRMLHLIAQTDGATKNRLNTDYAEVAITKKKLMPPAAVTTLAAAAPGTAGQVSLSWTVPNYSITGGKFRIDYSTYTKAWNVNNYQVEIDTSFAPLSAQAYTAQGLVNNVTYYFYLWVRDQNPGNWSALSNGATQATLCATPGSLSFAPQSQTSLLVLWDPNNNSSLTNYELESSTVSGSNYSQIYSGALLQFTTSGLTSGAVYYYRVRARGLNGAYTGYSTGAYYPFSIVSASTVDDDSDGRLDAYRIVFSTNINDASLIQSDSSGFSVAGRAGFTFNPAGLARHSDTANDNVIYLSFREKNSYDTDATPQLTYNAATGKLKSMTGTLLMDVGANDLAEQDGAPPVIVSAQAKDENDGKAGIQTNDSVKLVFSEATNCPVINAGNIDSMLVLSGGHTWKSGSGEIILAGWTAADTLDIKLSANGSPPTVSAGDTITLSSSAVRDAAGNAAGSSAVIGGSFASVDVSAPTVASSNPENKRVGVLVDSTLEITFSKNMDETSDLQAVSLWLVKDNESTNSDSAVSFKGSYSASANKLSINPHPKLDKGCVYEIRISTLAADTTGKTLEKAVAIRFSTVIDSKKKNTVKDDNGKTKVVINENTFNDDFSINIVNDPVNESKTITPQRIDEAVKKTNENSRTFATVISSSIREIDLYDSNKEIVKSNFSQPVMLTIPYQASGVDGIVDQTYPSIREKTLRMYYLDEEHNLWVKVPGSTVDTSEKAVTAPCMHFSVYAIFGSLDTDLSDAYAFPVPFVPSLGHKDITFTNLSSLATIKIYTVSGELVRTIEHTSGSGQEKWDAANEGGEKVASGTYLYFIKNEKESKKGKLMVVR